MLNVFNHLEQKRAGAINVAALDIYSQKYTTLKERLIRAEREILKELGFVLYTEHPHKFILNYCKLLTLERDTPRLAQQAWNFINDSQRTNVCIKFAPEVSAARGLALSRCMHHNCRLMPRPLSSSPPRDEAPSLPAPSVRAQVICCAAIWMTARVLQLVLPPKWWELFDAATRRTWTPSARRCLRSTRGPRRASSSSRRLQRRLHHPRPHGRRPPRPHS